MLSKVQKFRSADRKKKKCFEINSHTKMEGNFKHVVCIKMVHMAIKTINKHFMSSSSIVMTLKACNDLSKKKSVDDKYQAEALNVYVFHYFCFE